MSPEVEHLMNSSEASLAQEWPDLELILKLGLFKIAEFFDLWTIHLIIVPLRSFHHHLRVVFQSIFLVN